MGGWSSDDDEVDPRALREAQNAARQARRLVDLVREAVADPDGFALTRTTICELNRLAVEGIIESAGELRLTDDGVITGSSHVPPHFGELEDHIQEMCEYVNESGGDAVHLAAFVLWRLNWIHPFVDGNGRAARAASYLVLCAALQEELTGEITFIERLVMHRLEYYRALDSADLAWTRRELDVTEMADLLNRLLEEQLGGEARGN